MNYVIIWCALKCCISAQSRNSKRKTRKDTFFNLPCGNLNVHTPKKICDLTIYILPLHSRFSQQERLN